MAGPFIFIRQSRIKEGRLDDFKRSREMAEFADTNEPRVIAFGAYINDDATEGTGVQIHPMRTPGTESLHAISPSDGEDDGSFPGG